MKVQRLTGALQLELLHCCDREIGAGLKVKGSPSVRTLLLSCTSCKIAVSTFWLLAMDPDRAAPNAMQETT